ncbi:MAG: PIN domain-containing protein [Pseudonocardiaceae bacterium]|nr:PIN domain-containing protein [Pseudonocardiaceae bacterium]
MILVDSDVLIASLRGVDAARDWLHEARTSTGRLAVSVVTNAEIIGGMRAPERREAARLLGSLRPLPVTDMIAHRAGELRRRYRRSHAASGVVDYLIAATAQVHGLELATLNVKHFPMFAELLAPFRV